MKIGYVDGPRLRRSLVAACDYAQAQRQELNRINVFPVPDGDTGTNLALTVRAIADHLRVNRDRAVAAVAEEAARAAVLGARGNCGMMLSHFLLGFAREVAHRTRLTTREFAEALAGGVRHLYQALERPIEGTIITVMRETARAAELQKTRDFEPFLGHLVEAARASLARTPELLPVLRQAGVVDAGAKGFVGLLEGALVLVHGDPVVAVGPEAPGNAGARPLDEPAAVRVEYPGVSERFRFCTEALVRGDDLPSQNAVRHALRERGDSLIVIRSEAMLKVHVHTDDPDAVFQYLRTLGTLATHKAEDMHAQHATVESSADQHIRLARRPVTVMTDSACDLAEEIVRAHGIHVTPLLMVDGDRTYRDRIDLSPGAFLERLEGEGELPTTSQPAPADFLETFAHAAEDGEEIVGVILSGGLSGTFQAAEAAAAHFHGAPVHLVDSGAASLLQGLLVLKACELAELATPGAEIAERLRGIRTRSGLLFTLDRFDRLVASGRVSRGRALLGSMLQVKPVLCLDSEGRIEPVGKAMGRERARLFLLDALTRRIPAGAKVRFGVAHVGCSEIVPIVAQGLRERFGDVEILSGPATPVLATHLGIGAWAVAYMVE